MERIEDYPWLQKEQSQLQTYLNQRRIPQALLISGAAGMGKFQLALFFARMLMCESPLVGPQACGQCPACQLLNAETHPDLMLIQPEEKGKQLTINLIRQLLEKLTLKPQYQAQRVVIIRQADALNNAAANAFLKCLEEPGERTSIILLAEKPYRLSATIRSRCQKMPMKLSDRQSAIVWLNNQHLAQPEALLEMAQGGPLTAQYFGEQNYLELQTTLLEDWLKVADAAGDISELVESWQKQTSVTLPMILRWLGEWVALLIKLKYGLAEKNDHKFSLQERAERLNLKSLYQFYDFLLLSRRQLESAVNPQLLMEQVLIEWQMINR